MNIAQYFLPLLLLVPTSFAETTPPQPAPVPTYAQIVRLSLVEGDVRLLRSDEKGKPGKDWEQAAIDIPLETGFTLASGTGRAEIEFEDGSTAYLGDNSILTFTSLTTRNTIPDTQMLLVTGAITVDFQPVQGETFLLRTESASLTTAYPRKSYVRVNSYIDGISVSPLESMTMNMATQQPLELSPGNTEIYPMRGRPSSIAAAPDDFDTWVTNRVAARDTDTAVALKASGLSASVPGLIDLNRYGTFFSCGSWGTCWEPRPGVIAHEDDFPVALPLDCSVDWVHSITEKDIVTGKEISYDTDTFDSMYPVGTFPIGYHHYPFAWGLCHAGGWIYYPQRRHYVWVAGLKLHHRPPFRWVKNGRSTGFVPLHPHDVAGKPPLNLKNGIVVPNKDNRSAEFLPFNASKKVEPLATAPKEFRDLPFPTLTHADPPHMEGHAIKDVSLAGRSGTIKPAGIPITFDNKSHNFMLPEHIIKNGKSTTVLAPVSGRQGSSQGRNSAGGSSASRNGNGGTSGARQAINGGSSGSNAPRGGSSSSSSGGSSAPSGGNSGGASHSSGGGGGGFSGGGGGGGASHGGGGRGGGGGGAAPHTGR